MLRSMPVRRFKRGFKLGLIKLLIGNKATGVHLSYVCLLYTSPSPRD